MINGHAESATPERERGGHDSGEACQKGTYHIVGVINLESLTKVVKNDRTIFFEFKVAWEILSVEKWVLIKWPRLPPTHLQ